MKRRKQNKTISEVHSEYRKENFIDIDTMYSEVKREYLKLDENNELNIGKERVRLYKKFADTSGKTINLYIAFLIASLTSVITSYLQFLLKKSNLDEEVMFLLFIVTIVSFFVTVAKSDKKIIDKEKNEIIYYKICLEVLDQIEKKNIK